MNLDRVVCLQHLVKNKEFTTYSIAVRWAFSYEFNLRTQSFATGLFQNLVSRIFCQVSRTQPHMSDTKNAQKIFRIRQVLCKTNDIVKTLSGRHHQSHSCFSLFQHSFLIFQQMHTHIFHTATVDHGKRTTDWGTTKYHVEIVFVCILCFVPCVL